MEDLETFMAEHIGVRGPWEVSKAESSKGPDGRLEDHITVDILLRGRQT